MVQDARERGLPLAEPTSTSIDFCEFDPMHSQSQYIVEWLTVETTEAAKDSNDRAQQAA